MDFLPSVPLIIDPDDHTQSMQANELELLVEYTRAQKELDEIVIEVASIEWQGSHDLVAVWQPVTHISIDSNAHQIIAVRLKALKRKRYFWVCIECGFRHAVGHMHDADICQGCASKKHGVVY